MGILVSKKIYINGGNENIHAHHVDVWILGRHKENRNDGDCVTARGHR